jgi:4-oxalocrotonate tautomerase
MSMAARAPNDRGSVDHNRDNQRPIVTKITREHGSGAVSVTSRAAALIRARQLLLDVLNKPSDRPSSSSTRSAGSWGWGGLPVPEYRRKLANGAGSEMSAIAVSDGSDRSSSFFFSKQRA